MQINFAVRRVEAAPECRATAAPGFDAGEREFDVLASAQIVGGEVRAGAEVFAGAAPADRDAVVSAALRIGDGELGEYGLGAEVFNYKGLIPAELPAQTGLPLLDRHLRGTAQARQPRFG